VQRGRPAQAPPQLAIDLGTSHTVAVVRRTGQPPRVLLVDGLPLFPSGVFAGSVTDPSDGALHTGRDAERLAQVQPERYEPHPKRRVDEGSVLLGDREVPVPALLAAVLARVATEAADAGVRAAGGTVLTCPADWGRQRRAVLTEAAGLAGLGDVTLVDEPVAAATYCVDVLGHTVSPGQTLVVFDFGGGTLDLTLVRREPAGLRVLATGGLDDLGGLDVDAALVGHLGHVVALRDEPTWRRLGTPRTAADLRDRRGLWLEVRAAKEMLSRTASAPVQVPGWTGPVHLTREELERVAGPLVARAVDETRRLLDRAGPGGGLAGLFLVGGSSRVPLVASRLHARFGVAPTVPEQPELPVAYGALLAAAPAPVAVAVAVAQHPQPAPARVETGPQPYIPMSGTAPPTRRPRRTALVVVAAVAALVLAAGGTALGIFLSGDRGSPPAAADTGSDTGSESQAGSDGVPAGFATCEGVPDGAFCPKEPSCWGGLVSTGGAQSTARAVACEQDHYWESYAGGRLPADAVGIPADELATRTEVTSVCDQATMSARSREPTTTDGWRREILTQQVRGRTDWLFHCVAGPAEGGEREGSAFQPG
jgi:molecular chaperone HscA